MVKGQVSLERGWGNGLRSSGEPESSGGFVPFKAFGGSAVIAWGMKDKKQHKDAGSNSE